MISKKLIHSVLRKRTAKLKGKALQVAYAHLIDKEDVQEASLRIGVSYQASYDLIARIKRKLEIAGYREETNWRKKTL